MAQIVTELLPQRFSTNVIRRAFKTNECFRHLINGLNMRTATDDNERKCLEDVKNHGLHIMHVFEDEENPRFSYTVGLYENYLHPEIIIIGLKHELAHLLLHNAAYDIKKGTSYTSGEFHEGILDDFLCYFGDVPRSYYEEYVGWALWFYEGRDFPLIQCVYPTVAGKFAWEKDFPGDARFYCQMLTDPPKEH